MRINDFAVNVTGLSIINIQIAMFSKKWFNTQV